MRKGFALLAAIAVAIAFAGPAVASDMVLKAITAQNQFTDAMQLKGPGIVIVYDTSSMSMTVSLQISPDGGTTWVDTGDTWTGEGVDALSDGADMYYRVGVKTGDFTSGTATVYLISQSRK